MSSVTYESSFGSDHSVPLLAEFHRPLPNAKKGCLLLPLIEKKQFAFFVQGGVESASASAPPWLAHTAADVHTPARPCPLAARTRQLANHRSSSLLAHPSLAALLHPPIGCHSPPSSRCSLVPTTPLSPAPSCYSMLFTPVQAPSFAAALARGRGNLQWEAPT